MSATTLMEVTADIERHAVSTGDAFNIRLMVVMFGLTAAAALCVLALFYRHTVKHVGSLPGFFLSAWFSFGVFTVLYALSSFAWQSTGEELFGDVHTTVELESVSEHGGLLLMSGGDPTPGCELVGRSADVHMSGFSKTVTAVERYLCEEGS